MFKKRRKSDPETIVFELLQDGDSLYKIAKETGLSWPTIKKASLSCGQDYHKKTKRRLKEVVSIPFPI